MEILQIEKDIEVFCIEAESFPEGIGAAFDKLKSYINASGTTRYFGISHPDSTGRIVYKAAAELSVLRESNLAQIERFTIRKGDWISIRITEAEQHPERIGEAFGQLLSHPGIDPEGYCLEIYQDLNSQEVQCLVPLKGG